MAITVGELRSRMKNFSDDTEIHFEELSFYRIKRRGPKVMQIEFNEAIVGGDDKTTVFETTKAMLDKFNK